MFLTVKMEVTTILTLPLQNVFLIHKCDLSPCPTLQNLQWYSITRKAKFFNRTFLKRVFSFNTSIFCLPNQFALIVTPSLAPTEINWCSHWKVCTLSYLLYITYLHARFLQHTLSSMKAGKLSYSSHVPNTEPDIQ